MLLGDVLGDGGVLALPASLARMLADDVGAVEHRHPQRRESHPQQPAGKDRGNRVVLEITAQVVVAADLEFLPLDFLEPVARQRSKKRSFFGLENFPPGRVVRSTNFLVDLSNPHRDLRIQIGEVRPNIFAQITDHSLVHNVHCRFRSSLIPIIPSSG